MGKHKHGHKKSRKEKDSTSTASESEEVDISDQQVSDLSKIRRCRVVSTISLY